MSKRNNEDGARPITITTGDEPPERNSTLVALLLDGEKFKPGDPRGTLSDRLGAEVQAFQAEQLRVAKWPARRKLGGLRRVRAPRLTRGCLQPEPVGAR